MQVSKSKLKAHLLELLRQVESSDTEIIVTDRGKPVAKISKFQNAPTTEELFGDLRGNIEYFEELTAPTVEEWGKDL